MIRLLLTHLALAVLCSTVAQNATAADWLQFRGDGHTNIAPDQDLPTTWSEQENVAWRHDTPGKSASSPIVVNGRVIVTSASGPLQDRLHVQAFDAATGKQLWHRQFWATGRTFCHPYSSIAAPTPVSDGENIFAFFSSNDLICLDLDGNLRWLRGLTHDFPTLANDVGMSASPVVVGDIVVVQVESEGASFAAGLDATTGQRRWTVPRPKAQNWTSPATMTVGNQTAVLFQSPVRLTAYDSQSGKLVWDFDSRCDVIVSPLAIGETVYAQTGGGIAAIVQSGSTNEVDVLWTQPKLSPGAASPVVYRDHIYALKRSGILTCADPTDGKVLWQQRLKGQFWATPIAVNNHMYCINDSGMTFVVDVSDGKGKIVARNQLEGKINGSFAVVDGAIYIRGETTLWKIGS